MGVSDPLWSVPTTSLRSAIGHVSLNVDFSPPLYPPFLQGNAFKVFADGSLAHEIGHNLGLRHTNTNDGGGALDRLSCYPYDSSNLQNAGFDSVDYALVPRIVWDIMSYNFQNRMWVTPYTYDILVRGKLQPQGDSINPTWNPRFGGCPAFGAQNSIVDPAIAVARPPAQAETEASPQARPAAAPVDSIILSGTISKSGTATFDRSYRVSTSGALDESDPAGKYCVRFAGSAAAPVTFCFDLSFIAAETGAALDSEAFSFQVAFPPQTTQIDLLSQGKTIASATVSRNAPVIAFVSPKSGDQWNGGTQSIQWNASDADGDSLTYILLYSTDGGVTYVPIDMDLTATQYMLDPSKIMGGSQVYFRVMASDGINTAAASVGPVNVKQAPRLSVPIALSTPNAATGQSVMASIAVANTGTGPATITATTINSGAFTVLDPPVPFVIPAGKMRSLTVQFSPAGTGVDSGTLSIASDDPTGPAKVSLSGQSFANPVPDAEVASISIDFGSVPAGQAKDLPLTVLSAGGADLIVNSVSSSNASFLPVGVKTPLTIPAGQEQAITIRFAPSIAGSQTGSLAIVTNDPVHSTRTVALTGTGAGAPPAGNAPQIRANNGILNAASFQTPLVRGSLAALFGSNLANGIVQPDKLPLPTNLGGAQVTFGGFPAPLIYVSPGQINFQVPFEAPISGTAQVVAIRDGTPSAAQAVSMTEYALGIFSYARNATTLDPIIVHANNTLVTPSSPAVANEILVIYSTGAGTFDRPPATGAGSSGTAVATTRVTPTVTVGGAQAQVLFSGLTPSLVGVVQINIKLPASLPAVGTLPLVVQFGASSSPSVNLNVAGQPASATGHLALTFLPNPATQGSDGKWTYSLTLYETAGVGVTITKLTIGGIDSTFAIAAIFGSTRVGPMEVVLANLSAIGYTPPVDLVYQFTGNDDAGHTGLTWTGAVRLNGPVSPPISGTGDTTTGLVSWWKFDEGSGQTVRDSVGANNGTIQGTAVWTTGKFGGALDFNGTTNYVLGANAGSGFPVGSAARTISAWVKASFASMFDTGIFHYGTVGNAAPATNFHLFMSGEPNTGKIGFGNGYGFGTVQGTTSAGDGGWHNIVGVYDGAGGSARIYVDGVQQVSGPLATTPNTGTGTPWQIGRFQQTSFPSFSGPIDDVRIYNRALSATDVQALYNGR